MCLVRFKNTNERNINNEIAFFGYFVFYKDFDGTHFISHFFKFFRAAVFPWHAVYSTYICTTALDEGCIQCGISGYAVQGIVGHALTAIYNH